MSKPAEKQAADGAPFNVELRDSPVGTACRLVDGSYALIAADGSRQIISAKAFDGIFVRTPNREEQGYKK